MEHVTTEDSEKPGRREMLSKRIARDWGESGPKESSAGSDVSLGSATE